MAAGEHVGVRSHSLSCPVDGIWPGGRRAGHGRESAGTRDGERVWKAVPVPRLRVHRIRRTRCRGIDHRSLSNVVPRLHHSGAHDPAGSSPLGGTVYEVQVPRGNWPGVPAISEVGGTRPLVTDLFYQVSTWASRRRETMDSNHGD